MERSQLTATIRQQRGSNECGRLRRTGQVPAVAYGRGMAPQSLAVNTKALREILAHHHGSHAILDLVIQDNGGTRTETVLVQEIQRDPVTHQVLTVDFMKVSLQEKITTTLTIALVGQAKGIKEGGIIEHQIHEVEVECLPTDLPEELTVDMTPFGLGASIHVSDIVCPAGVTILTGAEEVIAHINVPKLQAEVAEEPVEPSSAEPELVKQKGGKEEE